MFMNMARSFLVVLYLAQQNACHVGGLRSYGEGLPDPLQFSAIPKLRSVSGLHAYPLSRSSLWCC